MNKTKISNDELLALSAKRFEAVGRGDLDATMALFIDEPCFDLYPVGLRLGGQENVRRYYENLFRNLAPAIVGTDRLGIFIGDNAVSVELRIRWQPEPGVVNESRILAIQPVEGGKFTGERLYGDERFLRWMFGGGVLEPISA